MGKFALIKSIYSWNEKATDNKFINNALFWILNIVPVYGAAAFVDAVILNLIEFWTGSNPMAMTEGQRIEKRMDDGQGHTFLAIASPNRMEIRFDNLPQNNFAIQFQPQQKAWILETESKSICLAKQLSSGKMTVLHPDGICYVVDSSMDLKSLLEMATETSVALR